VVVLDLKGLEIDGEMLKVQAGEKWDDTVNFAVKNGLSGIEALSLIPGTTGAAPIQNIGAYGAEIGNSIEYLEAYDRDKKEFVKLEKTECQFEYRNSIFKKNPHKFIVISVTLKLSKNQPVVPKYKDVENYFNANGNSSPNLAEIREAIIKIRMGKLPDPKIIPNVGSYFTNPILEKETAASLKEKFPDMPSFQFGEKEKISAGWLIENVGLKGAKIGKIQMSPNNALVLTNPEKVGFEEIDRAENFIKQKVFDKFGINLVREPIVI
jgi:UDP-N-acetylmuramate dehydrogenase